MIVGHSSGFRPAVTVLLALILAVSLALKLSTVAQEPPPRTPGASPSSLDNAALHQALLDLTSPWTVMCLAAHPDDEDGTTLTMLRRKFGIHTVSLFSTYGEGGQNAVGPELYEELGVIRVRETIAASNIQGSEPHFLGLRDFGYSKSAEETFRTWGEKEALRRMVLKIRELRPDVIITNHNTVSGHGQHQATGRLILQAFDAAADPNRFPEQLAHVQIWQPQRLFVRFGFEGNPATKALEGQAEKAGKVVTVDPNEKDPVRNTSFAEQALAALQHHATQGPWPKSVAERLRSQNRTELPVIRYRLAKEIVSAPALTAGAKNFFDGLRLPLTTGAKLAPPAVNEHPLISLANRREEALVALINARRAGVFTAPEEIVQLDPRRFRLMSDRLDRALAVASGAALTLTAKETKLVPGIESQFTATIANSGETDLVIKRLTLTDWGGQRPLDIAEKLPPGTDTAVVIATTTPRAAPPTVPAADHLYDGNFLGETLAANVELQIEGARFSINTNTQTQVFPAVEIKAISLSPPLWSPHKHPLRPSVKVTLANHLPTEFHGLMKVNNKNYFLDSAREITLRPGETRDFTVEDHASSRANLRAHMRLPPSRRQTSTREQTGNVLISIEQAQVPTPLTQKSIRAIYTDARVVPGLIGYLPSFDQTLKEVLAALGLEAKELTTEDIGTGELADYDTIIIDNRGYQAHPDLIGVNQKLLDHMRNGGTLIVFYHKANEWNPDEKKNRPQLAPYPIILGDDRVTEEDAPVKLLRPGHPVLRFPNRITSADFRDWVQERGLYYPTEWDQRYEALISTNDKGEAPLRGGLLVARYGKGNYIYTSMVWYRQLMAGVPGAYRAFANMVSYGREARRRLRQNQIRSNRDGVKVEAAKGMK